MYAYKVARISLIGTMFNGTEQWSTGFYMGHEGADATQPTESFLAKVDTAWNTFFTKNNSYMSGYFNTTEVRGALLDPVSGKTIGTAVNHFIPTPYSGSQAARGFPGQIALAATFTTAVPRGLGSKGRMYLPGVCANIEDTGKIPGSILDGIVTNLHDFLGMINQDTEQPGKLITASKGSKKDLFSSPVNRLITGLKIGDVYDTQQRRRNQLVEQYHPAVAFN